MARKRAFVLIIVLPVLGLLAVLGSAFVAISMSEVRVTKGYVSKTRARMVACAGIERAIAELRNQAMRSGVDSPQDNWIFRNNAGTAPGHGTPLLNRGALAAALAADPTLANGANAALRQNTIALAGNPSFRIPLPTPAGTTIPPSVPATQFSGVVGGTNIGNGDYYTLKVLDCASMLNLNSPHLGAIPAQPAFVPALAAPARAATWATEPDFVAMLDNLLADLQVFYQQIGNAAAAARIGALAGAGLTGANIFWLRVSLGGTINSKRQLLLLQAAPFNVTAGGTPFNEDDLVLLSDFVTVRGFRDVDVVGASPAAAFPTGDAGQRINLLTERNDVAVGANPAYPGRFPVNVNTAPRPVLFACMRGLSGKRLLPKDFGQTAMGEPAAYLQPDDIVFPAPDNTRISATAARAVADAIIQRREQAPGPNAGPFQTWEDFQKFLFDPETGIVQPGLLAAYAGNLANARAAALLICANANPNTRAARFNPNMGAALRARLSYDRTLGAGSFMTNADYLVDKQMLTNQTTEFCFSSMGFYELESVGRIADARGFASDECQLTAVVKIYDVLRHTTERDFVSSMPAAVNSNQAALSTQTRSIGYFPDSIDDRPLGDFGSSFDGNLQLSSEWELATNNSIGGTLKYATFNRASTNMLDPTTSIPASRISFPNQPDMTESFATGGNVPPALNNGTVFGGNDLQPDGTLSLSRGPGQTVSPSGQNATGENLVFNQTLFAPGGAALTPTSGILTQTEGTIDMWIKLDSLQGSNEMLAAIVSPRVPGSNAEGVCWRLDRMGTTLFSTRFYWFAEGTDVTEARSPYPDAPGDANAAQDPTGNPAFNGVVFQRSSVDLGALQWKAGEWHKLRHSWPSSNAADPGDLITHRTFVDSTEMVADVTLNRDKSNPNPSVTSVTITLDPGFSSASFTLTNFVSNVFLLGSFVNASQFFLGGYQYLGGAKSIFQSANLTTGMNRFSSCTIDEVRVFTGPGTKATSSTSAPNSSVNRYNPGGGTHVGNLTEMFVGNAPARAQDLSSRPLPPGSILGTIGFSAYFPTRWGSVAPGAVGTVSMSYVETIGGAAQGGVIPVPPAALPGTPQPVYLNSTLRTIPTPVPPIDPQVPAQDVLRPGLQYTLTLQPNAAFNGELVLSPIVDDVTLTVISTPQILDFGEDSGL
ncbi:MAG: hypothetical protein HYZ53_12255 [Planctomycetes bacterium]|nr:hypothetical protein [Planctomycetota bacterium]